MSTATLPSDTYTIMGEQVDLPLTVEHATAGLGVFDADADAISAQLPAGLAPMTWRPGRGLAMVLLVKYRVNPLGDYDEMVVGTAARPARGPDVRATLRDLFGGRVGLFVHHMPVNQEFTCEAGRAIWGFPKTVDDLRLRASERRADGRWADAGGEVLELTTLRGQRFSAPWSPGVTYTERDGQVLVTQMRSSAQGVRVGLGGARLRLGASPTADGLRALGLRERALASMWMEHATMEFGAARPLNSAVG